VVDASAGDRQRRVRPCASSGADRARARTARPRRTAGLPRPDRPAGAPPRRRDTGVRAGPGAAAAGDTAALGSCDPAGMGGAGLLAKRRTRLGSGAARRCTRMASRRGRGGAGGTRRKDRRRRARGAAGRARMGLHLARRPRPGRRGWSRRRLCGGRRGWDARRRGAGRYHVCRRYAVLFWDARRDALANTCSSNSRRAAAPTEASNPAKKEFNAVLSWLYGS
jgi:hypothetical protein